MDLTTDAPNHHADHPGFSGVRALAYAVLFALRRREDGRLAVDLTGTSDRDHVIDVGCGPGNAVRTAARTGARVTGIDPTRAMLRVARVLPRAGGRVTYLDGGAEALPLADASATVLWSLASIHHWPDVAAGLAEAHRVLQPGGRLLALERRTAPGADGLASHGWTDAQTAVFAEMCTGAGFVDLAVSRHQLDDREVTTVLARRPR